jgi:hypothetical protein
MPVRLAADTLHHALARLEEWDHAAAADARSSLSWLGWDGDGSLRLRRYDLQLYLWYQLPTKYLAPLEDKLAAAAALERLLGLLDLAYAELCEAPETLRPIDCWENDDVRARRELHRLLDASGLEPPDTALLTWGSIMGLEEAQARDHVASALEEALEAGTLRRGTTGFKRRRDAIVTSSLTTGGRLDAIHAERLRQWRASRTRGPIRELVADLVAEPPEVVDVTGAVAPARWLIERGTDRLALTQTGALNRALVREAVERWPRWWDTNLSGLPTSRPRSCRCRSSITCCDGCGCCVVMGAGSRRRRARGPWHPPRCYTHAPPHWSPATLSRPP